MQVEISTFLLFSIIFQYQLFEVVLLLQGPLVKEKNYLRLAKFGGCIYVVDSRLYVNRLAASEPIHQCQIPLARPECLFSMAAQTGLREVGFSDQTILPPPGLPLASFASLGLPFQAGGIR